MSLLDNNDDFEFEPHTLERTNTTEPLFESPEEVEEAVALQTPQRPKKKGKVVDDRKGSALSLGRRKPKDKDAATDKTPKRKRTKSISRSPPDSPKSSRAAPEPRKSSKATVPPLQPSPNVKGNRRRYSQFQGDSSSEDEGEKGTLLSNWAATEQDQKAGSAETSPRSIPTTPEPSEMSPLKRSPSPKPPLPPFPVSFPPQFSTPEKVKAGAPVALSPLQPPAFFHSPLVPRQAPPSNQAPLAQPWQPETTPTANEPDWSISEELRQKCHKQFLELRPTTGLLSGEQARHFFVQSKLPNHQLSLIWRLADVDKDNALSEEEFCIAMKLVVMRRKGVEMPSTLPEALLPKQELFTDSFWPQSASATQPQALPPPSQGFKQQQHAPFFSSHSAIDLPVPSDLSMTAEAHSPLGTQASAPDILAPTTTAEETRDSQRAAVNPILVEIGDTSTLDTGPLVSLEESHSEPPTGKIISLEGESEGDEDDTALVSKAATVESPTEVEQPVRDIKPARPAPPKPQVRRAKSLKAAKPPKPELPPRPHFDDQKRAVGGSSSSNSNSNKQVTSPDAEFSPSPPTLKSAEEYEAFPVITVDKASPSASARKGSRPTTLSPATGRKKYSALASEQSTPDASPNEGGGGGGGGGAEEKVVGGRFGWQQLKGSREKGHARASSLDLNKVLQSSDSDDVHKDMPSAVPPKPPPKPSIVHHHDDDQGDDKSVLRTRVRSASTGSIDVTEIPPEDPHILETSTNALLLVTSNKPRPHPRKAPLLPPQAKPRRPAPMMIKHRVEGESYQTISSASPPPVAQLSSTAESKATPTPAKTEESQPSSEPASLASASKEKPSPPPPISTAAASVAATAAAATGAAAAGGGQVPRDKIDMQMSIRSLKENNAALTEINKTLEEKLFKLMEDRVMLDRELVLANQLLQHHIQQQQQQQP